MVFLRYHYLNEICLQGFQKYRYRAIDTNPLSVYICHPFWDRVVLLVPTWVHPNVLTLSNFLFVLADFFLLSWYDWSFFSSSSSKVEIPRWVWLFSAFAFFVAHTLDGIDGKQARRTQTSSPIGELFDHGLDSMASVLMPMCLLSLIGTSESFTRSESWWLLLFILSSFYLSHWEKYITSVLCLPWSYDLSMMLAPIVYILAFLFGTEYFESLPWINISFGTFSKIIIPMMFFLGSIPSTVWNIVRPPCRSKKDETIHQKSFMESLRPAPVFAMMVLFFTLWAFLSPNMVFYNNPRLFYLCSGFVFSNITCRLIVAQMSNQPCNLFNWALLPAALILPLSIGGALTAAAETGLLVSYLVLVILVHTHYSINVVLDLADFLNVRVFSIPSS